MPKLTLVLALSPLFAGVLSAAKGKAAAISGKGNAQQGATAPSQQAAMKTQPAHPDPCAWITAAEATRLLGPLAGAPWRASHADGPEPDPKGSACGYTLASSGEAGGAGGEQIAVEVLTEDVTTFEASTGAVKGQLALSAGRGVADKAFSALGADQATPEGWDFVRWLPDQFVGRLGDIAIQIGGGSQRVPSDSIQRLAALVRDRVPDLPFEVPPRYANRGDGTDPCGLLNRAEAEAVLGPLSLPPYRSNSEKKDFADPRGQGCSYYLGKHRVFTITPTTEDGKTAFQVSSATARMFTTAVGAGSAAADTLDGPWDRAAEGIGGLLFFLKGDKMLEVSYGTAPVGLAGAVKLAMLAVKRL